jgi:hypothetical protein
MNFTTWDRDSVLRNLSWPVIDALWELEHSFCQVHTNHRILHFAAFLRFAG